MHASWVVRSCVCGVCAGCVRGVCCVCVCCVCGLRVGYVWADLGLQFIFRASGMNRAGVPTAQATPTSPTARFRPARPSAITFGGTDARSSQGTSGATSGDGAGSSCSFNFEGRGHPKKIKMTDSENPAYLWEPCRANGWLYLKKTGSSVIRTPHVPILYPLMGGVRRLMMASFIIYPIRKIVGGTDTSSSLNMPVPTVIAGQVKYTRTTVEQP